MADLLIELLSEEIPARMQAAAAADFRRLLTERLTAAGLTHEAAEATVTPRRLVLTVTGLPAKQPDRTDERKGPRPEAPPEAIEGFLKGCGLTSLKQAELRQTDKGAFYFAVRRIEGQATAKVLPGLIGEAVHALSWPKSMRWPGASLRWVRPLHSVLAVFDGKKLRGALPLGEGLSLPFTDATVGHRFLAPKRVSVSGFADYRAKLKRAKVLLDPAERRAEIETQAKKIATQAKLSLKDDPALLDELAGLVEWPVVLMGRIDARFMDLPPEVLTTSMRAHQRYLALVDGKGKLADRFLLVANMVTGDKGKTIVAGNERVLRARLADARFFWDQDCKTPLSARTPRLRDIVFHEKLGTLDDKMDRVQALAVEIATHIPGADKDRVRSAARLAKADLVTGMVGEFPELQGIMGRYYALHDGEHAEVAQAIAEHYSPLGPNDACPTAPVSVAVALADKIDTLVGFWAIDEKPTGSKDPYALRRAALGVIRLILENKLRLPLLKVFERASTNYTHLIAAAASRAYDGDKTHPILTFEGNLLDFFADRLKVALKDKGVRHDLIAAVFAVGGEDDLVRLLARVEALEAFLRSDDGANLLVAFQRAANIVRIEEKKDGPQYSGVDPRFELLVQNEEKILEKHIRQAEKEAWRALEGEDFTAAMAALAKLRRPVDAFFDKVTVNCDEADLRANRLRLLARIGTTLGKVADFSKIEG
jgi:glycyl-tRNA synthetase beta chain